MARDADSITWGRVRRKVETLIEERKDELVQAPPEQVTRLQAEVKALMSLQSLFDTAARDLRAPSDAADSPAY